MEHPLNSAEEVTVLSFRDRHRFFFLVLLTIVISITMTVTALVMYNVSGSAQLDLSRPGYQSVSDKVEREEPSREFNSFGQVTRETLEDFMKLFTESSDRAKAVDAFNGDPLNPETLEFTDTSATQTSE